LIEHGFNILVSFVWTHLFGYAMKSPLGLEMILAGLAAPNSDGGG